ncbi:MAG: long-chain fatty acid--CoA ligase [Vicinamibacterales bacterium]
MASLNLASVLEHTARLTPDRQAITFGATHLTYGQLDLQACRVAAGLAGLGIQPGDHVALSCPNLPFFPIAYFGILKAGAVVVPLNVLLKPREIAYHLRDSDARALIAFEGTADLPIGAMARAGCDEAGCAHLVIITADPTAATTVSPALTLGQIMHPHNGRFQTCDRQPDDTAVILYTSGTTGQAKGAELTHDNMVSNAITSHEMFRPAMTVGLEQDAALITLPLFHSTAQTCLMNMGLYGGLRLVLNARYEPRACLELMERERIGFWIGVPTMYWSLLQHVAEQQIDPAPIARHLKLCVSGGAPMPHEVMRRFQEIFQVRILEGYGLSEASPVVSFNQLQRTSKPGTVGLPIFGVTVACVDEQDRPVGTGERGEVVVRGPNVMKGYYNRPAETAEAFRGGWFHTGDIGTLDDDGYLTIVDRRSDMILRGGFNVYPREIEELMMTHPAVALVAVIGIPDDRLGEEVKALVVRRPGVDTSEQALVDWCRDRCAAYKYPRSVEFRDSLPVGATGKIIKRSLRGSA